VTRVVVTGLVTHGCVRVTSLGAKEAGYEVTLVGDAHSSYHKQAAEVIAEWNQKLAAQGVEVRTTEEISF
jgi:nicotinamidase-related amidase